MTPPIAAHINVQWKPDGTVTLDLSDGAGVILGRAVLGPDDALMVAEHFGEVVAKAIAAVTMKETKGNA